MLSVRKASEVDVPYLVSLRVRTMTVHLERAGERLSAEEHEVRARSNFDSCFLLLLNESPAGMMKLLKTAEYWELAQFQIEPALQSKGLGTKLLAQEIAAARQLQIPVRLSVLKENPAKDLYERLGFKVVGEDASAYQMQTEA